jgi:hypothetical protein
MTPMITAGTRCWSPNPENTTFDFRLFCCCLGRRGTVHRVILWVSEWVLMLLYLCTLQVLEMISIQRQKGLSNEMA